jgi:hypothetical protein
MTVFKKRGFRAAAPWWGIEGGLGVWGQGHWGHWPPLLPVSGFGLCLGLPCNVLPHFPHTHTNRSAGNVCLPLANHLTLSGCPPCDVALRRRLLLPSPARRSSHTGEDIAVELVVTRGIFSLLASLQAIAQCLNLPRGLTGLLKDRLF